MSKEKKDYFKKLGAKGGQKTAEKHGKEYMRNLGRKGGKATKARFNNTRNK